MELATICRAYNLNGKPFRLLFQDEARFGRMVRIRRCWSPVPLRPTVANGYQREYTYLYGAVSPQDGSFAHMISKKMTTGEMQKFIVCVGRRYKDEFVVMVIDGASSHKEKNLVLPDNVRLLGLPAYSPELNPCENLWARLRERLFPNRVYTSMTGVIEQLKKGVHRFVKNKTFIKGIVAWPWIIQAIMKAS